MKVKRLNCKRKADVWVEKVAKKRGGLGARGKERKKATQYCNFRTGGGLQTTAVMGGGEVAEKIILRMWGRFNHKRISRKEKQGKGKPLKSKGVGQLTGGELTKGLER